MNLRHTILLLAGSGLGSAAPGASSKPTEPESGKVDYDVCRKDCSLAGVPVPNPSKFYLPLEHYRTERCLPIYTGDWKTPSANSTVCVDFVGTDLVFDVASFPGYVTKSASVSWQVAGAGQPSQKFNDLSCKPAGASGKFICKLPFSDILGVPAATKIRDLLTGLCPKEGREALSFYLGFSGKVESTRTGKVSEYHHQFPCSKRSCHGQCLSHDSSSKYVKLSYRCSECDVKPCAGSSVYGTKRTTSTHSYATSNYGTKRTTSTRSYGTWTLSSYGTKSPSSSSTKSPYTYGTKTPTSYPTMSSSKTKTPRPRVTRTATKRKTVVVTATYYSTVYATIMTTAKTTQVTTTTQQSTATTYTHVTTTKTSTGTAYATETTTKTSTATAHTATTETSTSTAYTAETTTKTSTTTAYTATTETSTSTAYTAETTTKTSTSTAYTATTTTSTSTAYTGTTKTATTTAHTTTTKTNTDTAYTKTTTTKTATATATTTTRTTTTKTNTSTAYTATTTTKTNTATATTTQTSTTTAHTTETSTKTDHTTETTTKTDHKTETSTSTTTTVAATTETSTSTAHTTETSTKTDHTTETSTSTAFTATTATETTTTTTTTETTITSTITSYTTSYVYVTTTGTSTTGTLVTVTSTSTTTQPPPATRTCTLGTAYGYQSSSASSLLNTACGSSRWGWYQLVDRNALRNGVSGTLYVGAGGNNIANAIAVGTWTADADQANGDATTFTYNLSAGYQLVEVHIDFDCSVTCAPGQMTFNPGSVVNGLSAYSATLPYPTCNPMNTRQFTLHAVVKKITTDATCPTQVN